MGSLINYSRGWVEKTKHYGIEELLEISVKSLSKLILQFHFYESITNIHWQKHTCGIFLIAND